VAAAAITGTGVLLSAVVGVATAGDGATRIGAAAGLDIGAGVEAAAGASGGAGPTTAAGGSATGALEPPELRPLPLVTGVEADPLAPVPGWALLVPPVEPVAGGGAVFWPLPVSSRSGELGCEPSTGVALL
jgi:hypothetical protein